MMHMTFYWGRQVTILFDSWQTNSWLSYFISLLALFIFSVFYQYMEDKRLRFKLLTTAAATKNPSPPPTTTTPLLESKIGRWSTAKFAGAVMFGINSAIGYFLMLAVMSFNGGVFIAIVVGLGVGYLVFRCADDEAVVFVDNPCACA